MTIVDTVVANYFLAVGRFELLANVLEGVVQVPLAVFDPEEDPNMREDALSELRRGLRLHERRCGDEEIVPELRDRSRLALPNFERLPELVQSGLLVSIPLTQQEFENYVRFRDPSFVQRYKLAAGLGRGEAAALALAQSRSWALATDDSDCIALARALITNFRALRIRGLLKTAVDRGLIPFEEAVRIHDAMVAMGFWDRQQRSA